jgi:hypothetical protein
MHPNASAEYRGCCHVLWYHAACGGTDSPTPVCSRLSLGDLDASLVVHLQEYVVEL